MELSPLWLPGRTTTSLGVGGVTPTGLAAAELWANQDCSSGSPATGGRDSAVSLRAAPGQGRAHQPLGQQLAVRVARVQRDDVVRRRCAWPPETAWIRACGRAQGRGLPPVVRGSRRRGRPHEGPDARAGSRSDPAREVAQGLLHGHRAGAVLRDQRPGRRQPRAGGGARDPVRSAAAIRALLSSFMTAQSSATLISAGSATGLAAPASLWGLLGVAAFSFTVPVHPRGRRRPLAAVHRVGPRRRRRGPRRGRPRAHPPAPSARPAVGAARGRRRRRRRRLPAAHLVRAHHRPGQPRRGRHRAAAGRDGDDGRPARPRAPTGGVLGHRGVGAVAAIGFASAQCGGFGALHWSDLLLFGAVVAAAIGYAEGGLLARELGAWQTISWALVLCAPLMVAADRRVRHRSRPPSGTPVAVGRVRLPGHRQHVPRLLRLVPRPRDRPDGPGQPGAARPARADHRLGRPAAGRAADLDHHRRRPGRHPLRRRRRPSAAGHGECSHYLNGVALSPWMGLVAPVNPIVVRDAAGCWAARLLHSAAGVTSSGRRADA